ncbi:uncharacterized protein LOC130654183 [Hydractinia symbiolongicarpus]|uniref:uncharacterized protein LOC130654183 n=1 Tax=Hydractinia symbiolongicarpus TaxID=13093 RepID=UPI0025515F22|nr:uncharacterized protein LOC130654183 [Hydractinia symbiolongicarpus]
MRYTLVVTLLSILLIKLIYGGIGTPAQARQTIKAKVLSFSSLVISWLDTDFDGDDFTSFESVEISYRDAEDESATVTTESGIARTDHGKIITGLSNTIFYIFWVKYVNPGELEALPFIVGTKNINKRDDGVYDLLLKATPTKQWDYGNTAWEKLFNDETINTGLNTGFDNQDALSPFASSQTYNRYLAGMRPASSGTKSYWYYYGTHHRSLKQLLATQKYWESKNIGNFMYMYGPGIPSYHGYHHRLAYNIGNRIMFGCWHSYGQFDYYFGFGLNRSPYVGLIIELTTAAEPYYGYLLGQNSKNFIISTSSVCHSSQCGTGVLVHTHNCEVNHPLWKDSFCPPLSNGTCVGKECPFDEPQNLQVLSTGQYNIHIGWDSYDLSSLYSQGNFILIVRAYDSDNVLVASHHISRGSTQYNFGGLNIFSNYTLSVEGYSHLGNVEGNATKISARTKQGVPNGAASFIFAEPYNSSCMELKWEHIPEENVLGYLRSYELKYSLWPPSNYEFIETGLVKEYLVCGLYPFSDYRFELRARNDDYLSNVYDQIENKTGEAEPSTAPAIQSTTNSSNTSILIKWNSIELPEWNGVPYLYYVFYSLNGTQSFQNMTVDAPNTEANIVDLFSYTLYDFQVAAATRAGIGPRSSIVTEITGEHFPLSPPLNVTGEDINETSIVVHWLKVPERLRKGIIIGYNVTCYSSNLTEIIQIIQINNGSQLATNIHNLTAFTWYAVTVTAFTSVGAGPESNGTLIQSGIGPPDGYPLHISGYNMSSTSIFVRWDNISFDQWNGASDGFTLHISPPDIPGGKRSYHRSITSAVIANLEEFTHYNIRIKCYNEKGSGPKSPAVTILTDQSIPLKFKENVWGYDTGSYSLKVKWNEETNVREWLGYPYQYHVYYRRVGKSEFTDHIIVNASTYEVEIDDLEGYREYEVAVAVATTIGVGAYSDIEIIKTGEAPPTGPPQNVTGAYNNSRSIYVNWTEPIEEDTRGIITKYLTICITLDEVEMGRQNISSNDELTTIFGGLEIYTPYLVTIAAYTVAGLGPFSDPITVWTDAEAPFRGPYNLTGYNTSSTSIYIEWNDIYDIEWAGVVGNFRLTIQSVDNPMDKNTTNITRKGNEKTFSYEAKDLKFFTIYRIEVTCFNFKGVSPVSNITVTTEESWSIISPPNLQAVATGYNNISISWELPDETKIPGIIRGYTVRLQAIYRAEDLTIGTYSTRQRRDASSALCVEGQYCDGLPMEMDNITVPGTSTVSFNTTGLRGYTFYNVSLSVDTKFIGLASPPIQIFTPEGTPSMSAYNFTCEGVSYSSLLLQWKHSPPAYLEGIRTKYMIYYQLGNKIVNETDEPYKRRMELFFLKANTQYTVWMTAFTSVGEGKPTEKLNCSTFETEPTAAPSNVRASSFHYPYASLIQWEHIPDDQWQGSKQGYTIFYEKLSTGEIDVDDGLIKATRVDVPLTTSHVLKGLELYSVYRVRVAARSNAGVGFKSDPVRLETCHVPQAKLILNYMVYPPYVDYPKGNNLRPEGIVMDLTEQMLLTCAHNCTSFNQSVYISYNRVDLDSFSDIKNFTVNGTALQVPRLDTGKFTPHYSLVVTTTSPGFIILEVPDSPAQASAKVEDGLLDGIFSTLPICALYFILNWFFGAMFWFCEPTKVEHKGRGMSLAGIFEGLYLAIMTSTTVGYGDKIPETTSGRIYIVFWTLLGLVLTGIVTGSLSSALSVASINSMKQNLPDDKMLALYGSAEYTYGKKRIKKFEKNVTYYSYEELFEPLKNKTVKYALLDRYVAEILKSNISDYGLTVNKAFDEPTDFGVAAFGEMEKLKVCGTKFAKANTDLTSKAISKLLQEIKKSIEIKKANGTAETSSETTTTATEGEQDIISFNAPLYQKTLRIVLIMWLVCIFIGLIYEAIRRNKLAKLKRKIYTNKERKLQFHKDLKEFANETIEEFRDLVERVEDKIERLNYKHGKELLKMRTAMSKKYGVNFKFVKPSELGVSLEKILEYKEDAKNRPKVPFSVKMRRIGLIISGVFSRITRLFKR